MSLYNIIFYLKRYSNVIIRILDFAYTTPNITTSLIRGITSYYTTTFIGRLALLGAFRLVNTTRVAFLALGVVETSYFFSAFLAGLLATSRSSANYF